MPIYDQDSGNNDPDLRGLRVVAVHAHPDDESITMGGTLHYLARLGAEVTVITCTLGEQGEVIGAPYQQLIADDADQLGGFRISEWQSALRELRVRGFFLGGAGHWRDSGMAGDPAQDNPRAFVQSAEAGYQALYQELAELQPHLVLTYGPEGGYGHPDHIQAHQHTMAAVQALAEDQVWQVQRVAFSYIDATAQAAGLAAISEVPTGWRRAQEGELPARADVDIRVALQDTDYAAKVRAMKAHATQIWVADGSSSATNPERAFAAISDPEACPLVWGLSNRIAQPLLKEESFVIGLESKGVDAHPQLWSGIEF